MGTWLRKKCNTWKNSNIEEGVWDVTDESETLRKVIFACLSTSLRNRCTPPLAVCSFLLATILRTFEKSEVFHDVVIKP
jgi:hypothetical protein